MPKRKRNEPENDAPPANRAERLLADGQRNVAGALKVCQRFERQKLGRRVKDATADGDAGKDTLERLNREIEALKVRFLSRILGWCSFSHRRSILMRLRGATSTACYCG